MDSLHEFKFSIWRNEADAVLRLELAQLDALMKLAVVNGDRRLTRATHRRHDNTASKMTDNNNKSKHCLNIYRPRSRGDNTFGSIRVCVCPFVYGLSLL